MFTSLIPVANPAAQLAAHEPAIREAIERFLASGRYILGAEVAAFENEFAQFVGTQFCVGVGNGTDAIAIALRAVGITRGDEVITVSHTAVATVAAIEQIGAVPVFADIDPISRCIDPAAIEPLISSQTKAIVIVHIYGQPAAMDKIVPLARHHGLRVIEDCAQAHGAAWQGRQVGTWGDAAAFSFYPTKNLGALGDGGGVVTNSPEICDHLRMLREYGWRERYISLFPGLNSRLDELQAAVLRAKLPFLSADNERRREIGRAYTQALNPSKVTPPASILGTLHGSHLYVVESDDRDGLRNFLQEKGIGTSVQYPKPIHLQPAYAGRIRGEKNLSKTENLYRRIVSLPMFPELSKKQIQTVCSALGDWCAA